MQCLSMPGVQRALLRRCAPTPLTAPCRAPAASSPSSCSWPLAAPAAGCRRRRRAAAQPGLRPQPQRGASLVARADQAEQPEGAVVYNKEFGYSRKDVLLIIVALLAAGILMYEGLKATGMDAGLAGNWVQLLIFVGICVGWVSTYIWRVATKNMTYARQLQMYEDAVIQRRLEEMTDTELNQLMAEVEQEKTQGTGRLLIRKAQERQQQQQQQQQP